MATSRRLAGIASISIDGSAFDLVGDLSWCPNDIKRETLLGQDGVHGYSEMPMAGYISATIRDNGGITVQDFNNMVNSTVQLVQANGKNIIGTGMWSTDASEVKTQEGTFNVKFESDNVYEMVV